MRTIRLSSVMVKPQTSSLSGSGKLVQHTFPAASVTKLELTLE